MLKTVANMPEMILDAIARSADLSLPEYKNIRQIVFSGMGGSAISGDIIADLLGDKLPVPIYVNRSYGVPAFVSEETLFIAISYSGNTEETLSSAGEASRRKAKIACITSGGKLEEMAKNGNYPMIIVPSGHQPRAALPYLLIAALKMLDKAGLRSFSDEEIKEAAELLRKLKKEIGPDVDEGKNPIFQLAKKMAGRIPVILSACGVTAAAGYRLKTQLNENSKVTALYNVFPEMNHNEIVNLSEQKSGEHNFCLVLLRDEDEDRRIAKRMDITKSLLGVPLGGASEIWTKGRSRLAKVFSLIYSGDLLSVYLAGLRGIDPTPVAIITKLKRELAR